jgi:hypothetical protein
MMTANGSGRLETSGLDKTEAETTRKSLSVVRWISIQCGKERQLTYNSDRFPA